MPVELTGNHSVGSPLLVVSLLCNSSLCSCVSQKLFIVPANPRQKQIPYARVNHNKYMVTDRVAYIGTLHLCFPFPMPSFPSDTDSYASLAFVLHLI